MKVGFIGYGNMGGIVVRTLLNYGDLDPEDVVIFNRTASKLSDFVSEHPGVTAVDTPAEVTDACDMVFVCVGTGAVREVLEQIREDLRNDTHLVTINGGVRIGNLEAYYDGPISKVIPSVTMQVGRGISLIAHNAKVKEAQKKALAALFSTSSTVKEIDEDMFEVAGELTSCGPALMAEMMRQFAEAASRRGLPSEEALAMVLETMMGTSIMLADDGITVETLEGMVATKGGITEQGLIALGRELPGMYDQLMQATLSKHEQVKKDVTAKFGAAPEAKA
jgi:pyrroline-5-carboxylate reductase